MCCSPDRYYTVINTIKQIITQYCYRIKAEQCLKGRS